MPIDFTLTERLVGFSANEAQSGQEVLVSFRELIAPQDTMLQYRLDQFDNCLFCHIPGLPDPSSINHLLVVIRPDLTATAYVDELKIKVLAKVTGPIAKGAFVLRKDIDTITSVNLGVDVPPDCAIVFVRAFRWRRSLFFDLGPLNDKAGPREFTMESALAQQAMQLLDLPPLQQLATGTGPTRVDGMERGLSSLKELLSARCIEEARYQEVFAEHWWMLGGRYSSMRRHVKFDDQTIPDFVFERCFDQHFDIVELKQPFLTLFRNDGSFSAEFNDAWNQAERYLIFASDHRVYLQERKNLRFENAKCLLILGKGLSVDQQKLIRAKMRLNNQVDVVTYDEVIKTAEHILGLVKMAGEKIGTGVLQQWSENGEVGIGLNGNVAGD